MPDALPSISNLDLSAIHGGASSRDGMFAGAICSEAAWRDRRANYDQYASTIAYEDYCKTREPNSWAGRVNRGLDRERYGSVTAIENKPWHRFVQGRGPMPTR